MGDIDLTIIRGSSPSDSNVFGGNPGGCEFPLIGTQHVFYRALDGHVHEMVSPDAQGTGPLQWLKGNKPAARVREDWFAWVG